MSQKNPFDSFLSTFESTARCVQTHLSQLFSFVPQNHHHLTQKKSPITITTTRSDAHTLLLQPKDVPSNLAFPIKEKSAVVPLTKEELGRASWYLLHMIAAQYPDHPTRQQRRDVKELMAIISRLYPCKDCADHFKEILKANPVQAGSQDELSQWLCHVHNVVNRSLGKLTFPCQRVNARWGKLDCQGRGCDLEGTSDKSK